MNESIKTFGRGKEKQLKIWHIPQVPGKAFIADVETPAEAKKILNTLAYYDLFQYENNIKPDYSNANGLVEWDEKEQEWFDWYSEEGDDIHEWEPV